MKSLMLAICVLVMAGCGDTINQAAPAVTATAAAFANTSTAAIQLKGAAFYIPDNTACTKAMNDALATYGKASSVSINEITSTSLASHDVWTYPDFTLDFGWWYENYADCFVTKKATITP